MRRRTSTRDLGSKRRTKQGTIDFYHCKLLQFNFLPHQKRIETGVADISIFRQKLLTSGRPEACFRDIHSGSELLPMS